MRINKYLALCGLASRRKCEEYVLGGLIKINGTVVCNLATNIDIKKDIVHYNDALVSLPSQYYYYKLNKPKGYICSAKDEKGRKTIYSLLPNSARLFSIGRLDYNSEGLIIVTNDGDFAAHVAHPSFNIEKEYIVKIEGKILESELAVLRSGVVEDGVRLPAAKVKALGYENNQARISVIIDEGLNRQIRRMFAAIGRDITMLKRVAIGSVKLGGLQRGEYKELSQKEISDLMGGK